MENTFVYRIIFKYLIVCFTIILNIFIIVIIGCPILNCMIDYNVCNDTNWCSDLWKLLWAIGSGNPTSPPGYWL